MRKSYALNTISLPRESNGRTALLFFLLLCTNAYTSIGQYATLQAGPAFGWSSASTLHPISPGNNLTGNNNGIIFAGPTRSNNDYLRERPRQEVVEKSQPDEERYGLAVSFNSNELPENGDASRLTAFRNTSISTAFTPQDVSGLTVLTNCAPTASVGWTLPTGFDPSVHTVLVFARSGSAINAGVPSANGDSYTANAQFGSGSPYQHDPAAFCVYKGSGTTATLSNLAAGSTYHFLVFTVQAPATYSSGAVTSFLAAPLNVTGAAAVAGNDQLVVSWTNPATCFDEVLVIATENAGGVTSVPSGDGTAYVANSTYNNGTNNAGLNAGEYAVYKGTGTQFALTGLVSGTTYQLKLFTRKGTQWSAGLAITGTPVAAAGSFRSIKSGLWNEHTTWEKYNGSTWLGTTTGEFPNSDTTDVIINHTVTLNTSGYAIRNLAVGIQGKLFTNTNTINRYLNVYGNIQTNGTIGNLPAFDDLSFNIEGATCTISGSGTFGCSRLRKSSTTNTTTHLAIDMNISTTFSGVQIYNNTTAASAFNLTLNAGKTLNCLNNGSVSIDGANPTSGSNSGNNYGKFIFNGTANIQGNLFLTTNNANTIYKCEVVIGSSGVVNAGSADAQSSAAAGHVFTIQGGGKLNLTGTAAFRTFGTTNNVYNLLPGSTVEYSAAGAQDVESRLSYSHLAISGSGAKTFTAGNSIIAVGQTLTLSSATLALQSGQQVNIAANGTVAGNGGNFATGTAGGTISFLGAGTINGTVPLAFNSLRVNSGTVAQHLNHTAVANLQLTGGLYSVGTGQTLHISPGGAIASSGGNLAAGTAAGLVNFQGNGSVTGAVGFYQCHLDGSVSFGQSAVINNTLQLNTNGTVAADPPTYAFNSTLVYNSGSGNHQRNAEWSTGTTGPGVPHHVTIQNNTTLLFDANNASVGDRFLHGNLLLGNSTGAGSLSMGSMTKKIVVGGNLVIGNNSSGGVSTLALAEDATGGDIEVKGHWTRTSNGVFVPNHRAVFFTGTTTSAINTATTEGFDQLFINKTAGAGVTLANDVEIRTQLLFTSGNIATGSNKVIIGPGGTVTGAGSSTGWVAGNLQKHLAAGNNSSSYFEIGDAAGYRPVGTAFTQVATAGSLVAFVTQVSGEHPQVDASGIHQNKNVNRYFTLTPLGLAITAGTSFTTTFHYLPGDVDAGAAQANFVVRRYNGSGWTPLSSEDNREANATAVTVGQLASQNEFVIGECLKADASDFRVSATAACQDGTSVVTLSSTTIPPGTYSVSYDLDGANAAAGQSATVNLSGSGEVTGTFTTAALANGGATTITITAIQLAGTLHCSPALSSSVNKASFLVKTLSQAPAAITASSNAICPGGSTTLAVDGGSLGADGAAWKWYSGSCGNTPVGTGESITVSPASTTTYFVRAEGTCLITACQSITITVGSVNTWTGATGTDWNGASNWSCGFVPPSDYSVIINPVANLPVLSGNVSISALQLNAPATISLNGHTLTLNNGLRGGGTLIGSKTSSLVLNGGSATLFLNAAVDTVTNALDTLRVNGGTVTLGSKVAVYGVLDVAGGTLDLGGQPLVLKSNSEKTAVVAEIKGSLTGATNVTVERFIPNLGSRRWRLLTAPLTGTTINASWQEGHTWNGAAPESSTGFGTLITGQQQGTAATANSNGFDFWAAIHNSSASVRRYQGAQRNSNAAWVPLTSTFAHGFNGHEAYLLFVRGDRSVSLAGHGVTSTTLRATGTLKQGPQSLTLQGSTTQSHTLVGNPFASPIDFRRVYLANSSRIHNRYWLVNAGLGNGFGAYQVVEGDNNGHFEVVPLDLATPGHGQNTPAFGIIHSGSGFFVEPSTATSSIVVIEESHKSGTRPLTSVFRAADAGWAKLYINLSEADPAPGGKRLLDGVLARWKTTHGARAENNIQKAANAAENLSLVDGDKDLIITSAGAIKAGDTVKLRLWNTTAKSYLLETKAMHLEQSGFSAWLLDHYLHSKTPLSLADHAITPYHFSISADAASLDSRRFSIVFEPALLPLPIRVSSVRAWETNGGVAIEWKADDESGISRYEVERSTDALSFTKLAALAARGGGGLQVYESMDPRPAPVTWYRIRIVGTGSEARYSPVVKLALKEEAPGISIYPNPVTAGTLWLQLRHKPQGTYELAIFNAAGQRVIEKTLVHSGGTTTRSIAVNGLLSEGIYSLSLKMRGKKAEKVIFLVQK